MRRASASLRKPVALAAGLLAGAFVLPALASADTSTSISQSFYADSGDPCPHGITEGTLTWTPVATPYPTSYYYTETAVAINGVVVDQPAGPVTSAACASDGYSSTALFTVYDLPAGPIPYPPVPGTVLSTNSVTVDDSTASFTFTLPVPGPVSTMDYLELVVQVCRSPVNPEVKAPTYCGKQVTFLAPGPPVVRPGG